MQSEGSPPPMRGKVAFQLFHFAFNWITPAYAGKSTGRHHRESRKQDHPRLCGEKLLQRSRLDSLVGSPPPMRGKGPEDRCRSAGHGITPAYAGKSMTRFTLHRHTTDHPRLCGEKGFGTPPRGQLPGSPPPMRGKAEAFAVADFFVGITPAYAGKSTRRKPDTDLA